MRPAPPLALTAWASGGEVIARGGPLGLRTRDGEPSPGCRVLSVEEADSALRGHDRALGQALTSVERAYHLRARADLAQALMHAEAWACALGSTNNRFPGTAEPSA